MFSRMYFEQTTEIRLMEYSKNPDKDIVSGYTRSVNVLGKNMATQFFNQFRQAVQSLQGTLHLLTNNENYLHFLIKDNEKVELGEIIIYW